MLRNKSASDLRDFQGSFSFNLCNLYQLNSSTLKVLAFRAAWNLHFQIRDIPPGIELLKKASLGYLRVDNADTVHLSKR